MWATTYGKNPKDQSITPDEDPLIEMMRTKKHGEPLECFTKRNERIFEYSNVMLNLTCLELIGITHAGWRQDELDMCEPARGDTEQDWDRKERLRSEISDKNQKWEVKRR